MRRGERRTGWRIVVSSVVVWFAMLLWLIDYSMLLRSTLHQPSMGAAAAFQHRMVGAAAAGAMACARVCLSITPNTFKYGSITSHIEMGDTKAINTHPKAKAIMLPLALLSNISLTWALVSSRRGALTQTKFFRRPLSSSSAKLFMPQSSSYPMTLKRHTLYYLSPSSSNNPHRGKYPALSAAATSSTSLSSTQLPAAAAASDTMKSIIATAILILLDIQFRSFFRRYSISFPSSLAGCGAFFATMIGFSAVNEQVGEGMYQNKSWCYIIGKMAAGILCPIVDHIALASGLGSVSEVRCLSNSLERIVSLLSM